MGGNICLQGWQLIEIDFSAAFDMVNHHGILFKLCSMGYEGSVLSVLTQFLSNRLQYVMVDGCRSKLVNVGSVVPRGSVLGPQLLILNTAELFSSLESKLYGYADTSTVVVVVPSQVRELIVLTESLNRDLSRISMWCDLCGIKLNASKTKTMIVSGSLTIHPHAVNPIAMDGSVLKEPVDLVIFGVTFDAKITFEKNLRSGSRSAALRLVMVL